MPLGSAAVLALDADEIRRAVNMLTRRDILCQCEGGAGAVVSCTGMIVSLAAGLAGTAGSALIQRSGMAGMGLWPARSGGRREYPRCWPSSNKSPSLSSWYRSP